MVDVGMIIILPLLWTSGAARGVRYSFRMGAVWAEHNGVPRTPQPAAAEGVSERQMSAGTVPADFESVEVVKPNETVPFQN